MGIKQIEQFSDIILRILRFLAESSGVTKLELFWDRMHSLVKEQKKSTFTVPFSRPSGGTKNETAKSQNPQQRPTLATNENYNCIYLSNQHIDLEQRRPAHAKPDFNWLSGPRNGTWKRTCGISCLRSLAPMWRFAMQHHPGNIHQSFTTPRYSATPCYVLIQVPNVIDTISKRWRSKKAFNASLSHIFS